MMPRPFPLLVLALAFAALHASFPSLAIAEATHAATARTEESVFPAEQLRADLRQLRATLYASHIDAFAERDREAMDREFERVLARIEAPMTRADAAILFQRFVAFGNVAHARVEDAGIGFAAHVEADRPIVPFDIRVVEDSMHIADVYPGGEGLQPGDLVVSINDRIASELRTAMHRDVSADNAYLADAILEFEFPRTLWQQIGAPDRYAVAVQRGDERLELDLAANLPSERRSILDDGYLWLSWSEREAEMKTCDTAYLRPGPFYNPDGEMWDTTAFEAFIDDAFASFIEADAERLLIDLRNNPGGDRSFSDPMIAWFADRPFRFYSKFKVRNSTAARAANALRLEGDAPNATSEAYRRAYAESAEGEVFEFDFPGAAPRGGRRFEGSVHVLVNRHSYSNAVTTAAIIQDYGFGEILGEPTSDLATTLGAMEQFSLSHTGLRVGFPKARIVRPSGDERRIGVQPDVVIETPLVETNDDPVLKQSLARLCPAADR